MLFDLLGASEIQTTVASTSSGRRGSGATASDRPLPPDDDLNDSGSGFALERQQTTVGVNRLESLLDTAEAELRRIAENSSTPSRSFRGSGTPPPIQTTTIISGQSPFLPGSGMRSINSADGDRVMLENSARHSPAIGAVLSGPGPGAGEDELSPAQSALFEPRSPTEAEAFTIVWRVITDSIFQEELLLGEGSASLFVLQNFHYIVDLATSLVAAKSFASTISLPRGGGAGGAGGLGGGPFAKIASSGRPRDSVGSPYGSLTPHESEEDEEAKVAHVMAVAHASGLKALESRPSSVALQSLLSRVKRDEKLGITGSQPTSLSSTIQDWEALDVASGSISVPTSTAAAGGSGAGGPPAITVSGNGGSSSRRCLPTSSEGAETAASASSSGAGLLVAIGGSTSSLSSQPLHSPQSTTSAPLATAGANRSTSVLGTSHSISPSTRPKHSTITLETLQRRNEHELFCAALPSLCEGVLTPEEKDLLMESIRFLLSRLAQNPARRSELSPALGHLLTKNKNVAIHHAAPAIKHYVYLLEQTYETDTLKNLFCALADELYLLLASTAPPPALKGACLQGFCTALFAPKIALSKCPAVGSLPSPSSGMRAQSTATFRSESTIASDLSGNQQNGSDSFGDGVADPEQMNVLEPMLRYLFEALPTNLNADLGESPDGSNQRSSSSPLSLIQSSDAPAAGTGTGTGPGGAQSTASTPKGEKEGRGRPSGTFNTVVTNSAPQGGQSRPPLLLIRQEKDKHADPMSMLPPPPPPTTPESWVLEEKADLLRTGQRALAGILSKTDTSVFWTQAVLRSYKASLQPDPSEGGGGASGDSFSRSNSSWASPTSPGSTLATRYMSFPTDPLINDSSSYIRKESKTATSATTGITPAVPAKSASNAASFSGPYAKLKKKSGLLSLLCWVHEVLDEGAQQAGGVTSGETASDSGTAMCVTPTPSPASVQGTPPPKASAPAGHLPPTTTTTSHSTFEDRVIAVDLLASVIAWWYGGAQEYSEGIQRWMSSEAITSCVAAATGTLLRLAEKESATGSSDLFYHSYLNLVLTLEPLGAYKFSYCPLGPTPGGGKFFTDDLLESDYDPFNALQLEFTVLPTLETARGKKGAVAPAGLSTGSFASSTQSGIRGEKKNAITRPRAQTLFAGELKRILSRRRSGREMEMMSASPSVTPMSTPSNSRCNRSGSGSSVGGGVGGGGGSSGSRKSSHQKHHHHSGIDSANKIPDDTADLAAPVAHTMGALLSLQQHCGSTVTIAFDTSEDPSSGSGGGSALRSGAGGGSGNNAPNCRPVPWKKPQSSTPGSAVGSPFLSPSQTGRTVDLFGQSPPHSGAGSMNSSHSSAPPVDLFSAISLTAGFSTPAHFADPTTGGTAPVDLFSSWST